MTRRNKLETRHRIFKVFMRTDLLEDLVLLGTGQARLTRNHKQLQRRLWRSLLWEMYVNLIEPMAGVQTNWRRLDEHVGNSLTACGTFPPCCWTEGGRLWWSCAGLLCHL